MHGRPAAGMPLGLIGSVKGMWWGVTNADGRCPGLVPGELEPGCYTIRFSVAVYFRRLGVDLPDPPFLDEVAIDFGIADPGGHYHVPLLVSPYAYSTYRGS